MCRCPARLSSKCSTYCNCMYLYVFACNCMYLYVFACICMQLHVSTAFICICIQLHPFACICVQLLPTTHNTTQPLPTTPHPTQHTPPVLHGRARVRKHSPSRSEVFPVPHRFVRMASSRADGHNTMTLSPSVPPRRLLHTS